nr:MAG: RNA-dependent RNA polymerase [Riboviria sp.]
MKQRREEIQKKFQIRKENELEESLAEYRAAKARAYTQPNEKLEPTEEEDDEIDTNFTLSEDEEGMIEKFYDAKEEEQKHIVAHLMTRLRLAFEKHHYSTFEKFSQLIEKLSLKPKVKHNFLVIPKMAAKFFLLVANVPYGLIKDGTFSLLTGHMPYQSNFKWNMESLNPSDDTLKTFNNFLTDLKPINLCRILSEFVHNPFENRINLILQLLELYDIFWIPAADQLAAMAEHCTTLFIFIKTMLNLGEKNMTEDQADEVVREAITVADPEKLEALHSTLASVGLGGCLPALKSLPSLISTLFSSILLIASYFISDTKAGMMLKITGDRSKDINAIRTNFTNTWKECEAFALDLFGLCKEDSLKPGQKIFLKNLIKEREALYDFFKKLYAHPFLVVSDFNFQETLTKFETNFDLLCLQAIEVKNSPSAKILLDEYVRLHKELKELVKDVDRMFTRRQDPVIVWLYGKTAVGKTESVKGFADKLSKRLNRKLVCYRRNTKDDFWSGYCHQPIVLFDEMCIDSDGKDIREFFDTAGTAPYQLNCAAIQTKGTPFTSQFVFVCTNNEDIKANPAIKCLEAANRRRTLCYEVTTDGYDEYVLKEGRIPDNVNSNLYKKDFSHLTFTGYEPVKPKHQNQVINSTREFFPIKMDEVVDEIMVYYKAKEKAFFEYLQEEGVDFVKKYSAPAPVIQDSPQLQNIIDQLGLREEQPVQEIKVVENNTVRQTEGVGTTVLLMGDPGTGKTETLKIVKQNLLKSGATVLDFGTNRKWTKEEFIKLAKQDPDYLILNDVALTPERLEVFLDILAAHEDEFMRRTVFMATCNSKPFYLGFNKRDTETRKALWRRLRVFRFSYKWKIPFIKRHTNEDILKEPHRISEFVNYDFELSGSLTWSGMIDYLSQYKPRESTISYFSAIPKIEVEAFDYHCISNLSALEFAKMLNDIGPTGDSASYLKVFLNITNVIQVPGSAYPEIMNVAACFCRYGVKSYIQEKTELTVPLFRTILNDINNAKMPFESNKTLRLTFPNLDLVFACVRENGQGVFRAFEVVDEANPFKSEELMNLTEKEKDHKKIFQALKKFTLQNPNTDETLRSTFKQLFNDNLPKPLKALINYGTETIKMFSALNSIYTTNSKIKKAAETLKQPSGVKVVKTPAQQTLPTTPPPPKVKPKPPPITIPVQIVTTTPDATIVTAPQFYTQPEHQIRISVNIASAKYEVPLEELNKLHLEKEGTRFTSFFSDDVLTYTYGGMTHPAKKMPAWMRIAMHHFNVKYGLDFNGCVVNKHVGKNWEMPAHRDDEADITGNLISLNCGADAHFKIAGASVVMSHGEYIVDQNSLFKNNIHSCRGSGLRYCLTFREHANRQAKSDAENRPFFRSKDNARARMGVRQAMETTTTTTTTTATTPSTIPITIIKQASHAIQQDPPEFINLEIDETIQNVVREAKKDFAGKATGVWTLYPKKLKCDKITPQIARDNAAQDLIRKMSKSMGMMLNDKGKYVCQCFAVCENYFVTVLHAMHSATFVEFYKWPGQRFTFKQLIQFKMDDTVYCQVPDLKVNFPDMRKHLRSKQGFPSVEGMKAMLVTCDTQLVTPQSVYLRPCVIKEVKSYVMGGEQEVGVFYSGFIDQMKMHVSVETQNGDCGSVLVASNVDCPNKILGIHKAAHLGDGIVASIFREDLNDIVGPMREAFLPDHKVIEFEPRLQLGQKTQLVGYLEKPLHQSTQTALNRCPLECDKFGDEFEPTLLSRNDVRIPPDEKFDPGHGKMKWDHYGRPYSDLPKEDCLPFLDTVEKREEFLESCCSDISEWMLSVIRAKKIPLVKLTMTEAINRKSCYDSMHSMTRDTSPGYPYRMWVKKQKYDFLEFDEENEIWKLNNSEISKRLKSNISKMENMLMHGQRVPVIYCATLKDEVRPKNKIYGPKKKTRNFASCPMDITILFRQYCGAGLALFQSCWLELHHAIGADADSMDADVMIRQLVGMRKAFGAGDFADYDSTHLRVILKWWGFFICRLYDLCKPEGIDPDKFEREQTIRKNLFESLAKGYLVDFQLVLQFLDGIFSGRPDTSGFNCFANIVYVLFSWKVKYTEIQPRKANLRTMLQELGFIVMGDDNIFAYPNPEEFNLQVQSDILKQYLNVTLTSAIDKDGELLAYGDLSTVDFLKRKIMWKGNRAIMAPEDRVLDKIINWCNGPRYTYDPAKVRYNWDLEQLKSIGEAWLRAVAYRGKIVFDECREHLNSKFSSFGTSHEFPSYREQCISMDFYPDDINQTTIVSGPKH